MAESRPETPPDAPRPHTRPHTPDATERVAEVLEEVGVLGALGVAVHLTDKGVETMSPDDPDLFIVPDISEEVGVIEHDESLSAEQKIERRRELEAEAARDD